MITPDPSVVYIIPTMLEERIDNKLKGSWQKDEKRIIELRTIEEKELVDKIVKKYRQAGWCCCETPNRHIIFYSPMKRNFWQKILLYSQ